MSKPKFTQELIREEVRKALMVGPLSEINARISEVSRKLHIEHSLVVRSYCVTLAQIALGIMENAKDTIWISDTQTAVERIFEELAIDLPDYTQDGLAASLREFINFKPYAEQNTESKGPENGS